MNPPELPGFTYDPVKKRYFKIKTGGRHTTPEVSLPEYFNGDLSKKEYIGYVDDLISGKELKRKEWFNFQNRTFQLATSYTLPRSISQNGVAQIQMTRNQDSVIISDSQQEPHQLSFDPSDYSFHVSSENNGILGGSIIFLKFKHNFCFRVNSVHYFEYHVSKASGTGKLSLVNPTDVSVYIDGDPVDNKIKCNVTGIVISPKSYQIFRHTGGSCKIDDLSYFPKKFGEATCCLLISSTAVIIGFRNGKIYLLDISNAKKKFLRKWYTGDGPIVSLTLLQAGLGNKRMMISIGKHPFQKLLSVDLKGKVCKEFRTRFSNLSSNKELIYPLKDKEGILLFYGKRYESKFDVFIEEDKEVIDPSNLNWKLPDNYEIIDLLPYSRSGPLLLDRPGDKLRTKSILNVTFHEKVSYGFDNIGILALQQEKGTRNSIGIREFHV